ncbi:MAG: ABA4-like family protein [Saprospiraceae bacterium]
MATADIFQYANQFVMVGWLLLIIAPKWQWTKRIVFSGGIAMVLAVVYLVLFINDIENFDVNSFSTLEGVMNLFTVPEAVLMGWVHYLAFDLFIGMWEVTNAQRHEISHWLVIPCLLLTFMLGPIGLLTYIIVRLIVKKGELVSNF